MMRSKVSGSRQFQNPLVEVEGWPAIVGVSTFAWVTPETHQKTRTPSRRREFFSQLPVLRGVIDLFARELEDRASRFVA